MNDVEKKQLKKMIGEAELISFDMFDTLVFRRVNEPETIFDLVGKHFGIHGFRKLRMDEQNEASRRMYEKYQYPHANMDEIYAVLAEHTEYSINWNEVKEYEIQLEKDALVANKEMLELFSYAKELGKRVVVTSDMYLLAHTLEEILIHCGYTGIDYVYCSADEHKAKFNKELFELVAEKEHVNYENILHIGDKERDDSEFPGSFGIKTFVYRRDVDSEKINKCNDSDIDKGLYKILYDANKGFAYNLGIEVGGPLYMALFGWLSDKVNASGKKIYFLARDGYNLYHIFKEFGYENIEYLYTSRRALTLASIKELNEQEIETLPPYTKGQTVEEILDYLCINKNEIKHLHDVGFESFLDVIRTDDDIASFKRLYVLDKDVFLERCQCERESAIQYFDKIGFFKEDALVFDCGWQGSSQDLVERFKKSVQCDKKHFFYYFGIKNSEKSRHQLHGMQYDTYLFDFYKNYALQAGVNDAVVLYELFFSAPEESVFYYDNGNVVFEDGEGDKNKIELLDGILAYLKEGFSFVKKYDVEYSPEMSVGHLQRLIQFPTEEEAIMIGNIHNVDGFARKKGEEKYIAYITSEQLEHNPETEIYWLRGLLRRPDVEEAVKVQCAARAGIQYPEQTPEYHLEEAGNIRNYRRWMRNCEREQQIVEELSCKPKFSIVIPVYNTITEQLQECIDSVLAQNYENYELILVDDHSSWESVVPVLQCYEKNEKVRVIYRTTNGHISAATNDGIFASDGDFIVFMDCDDIITDNALYEMAKMLNDNPELDFIYSDEDKITEDGKIKHLPFFKPDWSPDLFLCMMYTNHLATYRASIVKEIGGLRSAYNGSQDYDFTLRFMEKSDDRRVGHISKVLYHWRERRESLAFAMTSKNYATEASKYAKEDYIKRNNLPAHMEYISDLSQYRIVYEVVNSPLVSIIIPSKDHPEILKQCIDSIYKYTKYKNIEIIVVDNGSSDANISIIEEYLKSVSAIYVYEAFEFNFSKMCNIGAKKAKGDYLLFLNDDIEIFQPDWLDRMLGHAQQKHIGAVGAKLFYPESTKIQHAGVSNITEGPSHNFMTLDDQQIYNFGFNRVDYNCLAVTAACVILSADKFWEIQGFDEDLTVAYNDMKLCFALYEKGYYNVVRNDVVAYHHESLSRGEDSLDDKKILRLSKEKAKLFRDFPDLKGKDPFLNINLHTIANVLDLKECYDRLQPAYIKRARKKGKINIDSVQINDKIIITGWSFIEKESKMEKTKRYLILEDPYGTIYKADTVSVIRTDVAMAFGKGEKYLNSGFESVLKKGILRLDLMPYRIGILTITEKGKRYITWSKNCCIERTRIGKPRPAISECICTDFYGIYNEQTQVQWSIDENICQNGLVKIRGYAYMKGNMHQLYATSIVLIDGNGKAYEMQTQTEERVDVAFSFPEEHYLFDTGFVCYMLMEDLNCQQDYKIVIRLRNYVNDKEIIDVLTGQNLFFD